MALNVKTDFGAVGDGVTDDRPAFIAASAALKTAGTGKLVVPTGRYLLSRTGAGPYYLDWTASNCDIEFERGARLVAMPNPTVQQVATVRFNMLKGVRLIGGTIDGNWGAVLGTTDAQDGINHGTQNDPKSHTTAVRGCESMDFIGVTFENAYGDCAWVGHAADPNTSIVSKNVQFTDCQSNLSARSGIALAGQCSGIRIRNCKWRSPFAAALDFEPTLPVSDVECTDTLLDAWWNVGNPARQALKTALTIDTAQGFTERVLIERCQIKSTLLVQRARRVRVVQCDIETMWGGTSWAPFVARFDCDDITLERCDLRTNCVGPIVTLPNGQTVVYQDTKNPGRAAIVVDYYAFGATRRSPRNVNIIGNSVYTSATDIKGMGVHGLAVGGQGEQGGTLRLEGNTYDVTDSAGHSNGGRGVDLFSEKPGIDVRMRNEVTRNGTGPAYRARFSGSAINAMRHLDIDGVSASDDQTAPTCTAVVGIDSARHYAKADIGTVTRSESVPADFVGWP